MYFIHLMMDCSGIECIVEWMHSNRLRFNLGKWSSFGAQLADDVLKLTPGSSTSATP